MARVCAQCGKGSIMVGKRILLIGHYNPTDKRRVFPNLHKGTLANGTKALLCTRCLRTQHKTASRAAGRAAKK